ncbi:hypothetical protein C2845_PM12G19860 [Panicum miliaceum]|uniref:Uncharacterized protein n=1 Tax=Panicum miliaceum TaxID=4540 RepID=A0A3L6QBR8_PANMI|nr:hypothetical protein C2845_PM12G19860 [Panicum miliaceum]
MRQRRRPASKSAPMSEHLSPPRSDHWRRDHTGVSPGHEDQFAAAWLSISTTKNHVVSASPAGRPPHLSALSPRRLAAPATRLATPAANARAVEPPIHRPRHTPRLLRSRRAVPSHRHAAPTTNRPNASEAAEDAAACSLPGSERAPPPPPRRHRAGSRSAAPLRTRQPPASQAGRRAAHDCSGLLAGVARGHCQPLRRGHGRRRPPWQAASRQAPPMLHGRLTLQQSRDLPFTKSRRKEKTVADCARRSGPSIGDDNVLQLQRYEMDSAPHVAH